MTNASAVSVVFRKSSFSSLRTSAWSRSALYDENDCEDHRELDQPLQEALELEDMAAPAPANACPEGVGTTGVRKGQDDEVPEARSHLVERPAERDGKRHCRERGLSQEPLQILPSSYY